MGPQAHTNDKILAESIEMRSAAKRTAQRANQLGHKLIRPTLGAHTRGARRSHCDKGTQPNNRRTERQLNNLMSRTRPPVARSQRSPDLRAALCRSLARLTQPQVISISTKNDHQRGAPFFSSSSSSMIKLLVNNLNINLLAIILLTFLVPATESVDCFKCSSRNGSNPACEDPFHNLNSTRITSPIIPDPTPNVIYHTPCYAGKKGRDGLFPASACIKLTGTFDTTGETLVVRHCALDSGTLTQDTELARMSHCGKFQFDGDLLKGCVLACPEDACNSAPKLLQLDHTKNLVPYVLFSLELIILLAMIIN